MCVPYWACRLGTSYSLCSAIYHPQSLKEIKKKVNNGTYPNTDAFAADIHQMLANAMTYVRLLPLELRCFHAVLTLSLRPDSAERGGQCASLLPPALLASVWR